MLSSTYTRIVKTLDENKLLKGFRQLCYFAVWRYCKYKFKEGADDEITKRRKKHILFVLIILSYPNFKELANHPKMREFLDEWVESKAFLTNADKIEELFHSYVKRKDEKLEVVAESLKQIPDQTEIGHRNVFVEMINPIINLALSTNPNDKEIIASFSNLNITAVQIFDMFLKTLKYTSSKDKTTDLKEEVLDYPESFITNGFKQNHYLSTLEYLLNDKLMKRSPLLNVDHIKNVLLQTDKIRDDENLEDAVRRVSEVKNTKEKGGKTFADRIKSASKDYDRTFLLSYTGRFLCITPYEVEKTLDESVLVVGEQAESVALKLFRRLVY